MIPPTIPNYSNLFLATIILFSLALCALKHYEKNMGEWDKAAQDYKFLAQEYQKYFC
jgi:hypothetical protein